MDKSSRRDARTHLKSVSVCFQPEISLHPSLRYHLKVEWMGKRRSQPALLCDSIICATLWLDILRCPMTQRAAAPWVRVNMGSGYVDSHQFQKNWTNMLSTFARLHKNSSWKRKSASDENFHMRDILIFPVVIFVNFFSRFSLSSQIL